MTKKNQDFSVFQGTTNKLEFTVTDEDSGGSSVDLSGATIEWSLSEYADTAKIVTKSTGSGIAITDAINGLLRVTIDAADTKNLDGEYYHELTITDSTGNIFVAAVGTATIKDALNT